MTINQKERSVLLVGSIPLSSAEEVFEAISSELGKLIKRIPDGETGPRSLWIVCQSETMKSAQGLEVGGERQLQGGIRNPRYKIKEGQKLEDVKFGRLGYADNALESYKIFKRLQAHGKIPSGVRFQVCLPTPLAVVYAFFIASEVRRIWPLYEQRLLEELDEIARTISHGDLAIQLDIATEMHTLLEVPELQKDYPIDELVDAFARLGNRVPHDVELGIHLCYGDPGHKHVREPTDMGRMIDVYHRLATAIPRTITWLHMPVPRDRFDDSVFFAFTQSQAQVRYRTLSRSRPSYGWDRRCEAPGYGSETVRIGFWRRDRMRLWTTATGDHSGLDPAPSRGGTASIESMPINASEHIPK